MPGRTESALYESGRATAPPGVRYTPDPSLTSLSNLNFPLRQPEGYTHTSTSSNTLAEQVAQSPRYTPNYAQSPRYTPTPCHSPSYQAAIPKPTAAPSPSLPSQSPQYTPTYSASPHLYSPSFAPSTSSSYSNFSPAASTFNVTASPAAGKVSYDSTTDHLSSTLFNIPSTKSSKTSASPRYTPNYSNFSYFSTNQKPLQTEPYQETSKKSKNQFEFPNPKPRKTVKDDFDLNNYNIGDFQQFLSKHGAKIKSDTTQDSVTDSLLSFLQRNKAFSDTFAEDCIDNQVVVSICNKSKAEAEARKKENEKLANTGLNEDEKRCKNSEEKKKSSGLRKELLDELELDEKTGKKDAMSHHYQEEKHHKRAGAYGEYNQWDYLNAHESQVGPNHSRRGLPFCGSSQTHSMPWNPMGMVHQGNPYYSSPHMDRSHMMPAHAHAGSDYRYNQWANPNHKMQRDINMQSAHMNQNKMAAHQDLNKHHAPPSKPINTQDFGLPMGTEFSKMRNSGHDFVQRTPPPDMSHRTVQEYPPAVSPSLRNPPALPSHPKNAVGNPLSDLQMLVTSQDAEKPTEKAGGYQQESVDLSAHGEMTRVKDVVSDANAEKSVQDQNSVIAQVAKEEIKQEESVKKRNSEGETVEKPVELTAKNSKCKDDDDDVVDDEEEDEEGEEKKEISTPQLLIEAAGDEGDTTDAAKEGELTKGAKQETDSPSTLKGSGEVEKTDDAAEECTLITTKEVLMEIPPDETKPVNEENPVEQAGAPDDVAGETAVMEEDRKEPDVTEPEATEQEEATGEVKDKTPSTPTRSSLRLSGDTPASFQSTPANFRSKRKSTESNYQSPDSKKAVGEVELVLEKLLEAGTEKFDAEGLPTVSSTSADVKPSPSSSSKKKPARKRPARASRSNRSSSCETQSSKKKIKSSTPKGRGGRDLGPVLHVEGTRESPVSVAVVNCPKYEDDDEKKTPVTVNRKVRPVEMEYRGRCRYGLFSSTLSARYDAHSTDQTWICVLCKKGPHYRCLGDLYGPYVVTKDHSHNQSICDFSGDEKDISDAQKRGGRKKSIRANNMVEHFQKMSKKLRRQQSSDVLGMIGMRVVPSTEDDCSDMTRYEIWIHEQCVVWTAGLCLIGSRLHGLDEAIWPSIQTMCSKCGDMGASLGCVYRNCGNRAHYMCALDSAWCLEQDTFISTCHVHKRRS